MAQIKVTQIKTLDEIKQGFKDEFKEKGKVFQGCY